MVRSSMVSSNRLECERYVLIPIKQGHFPSSRCESSLVEVFSGSLGMTLSRCASSKFSLAHFDERNLIQRSSGGTKEDHNLLHWGEDNSTDSA